MPIEVLTQGGKHTLLKPGLTRVERISAVAKKVAKPAVKKAADVVKKTAPIAKKAAPAKKTVAAKKAAPIAKKAAPAKKTVAAKKVAPIAKKAAPAKKTVATKKVAPITKKAAPVKKTVAAKKAAPIAKKTVVKKEVKAPSYLCNMRIGAKDKVRIQKEAAKLSMTFQQFATEAVRRRLAGESPIKKIPREQTKDFDSVITCRFTAAQKKKVVAAAKAGKITVSSLVLGAVFGSY